MIQTLAVIGYTVVALAVLIELIARRTAGRNTDSDTEIIGTAVVWPLVLLGYGAYVAARWLIAWRVRHLGGEK